MSVVFERKEKAGTWGTVAKAEEILSGQLQAPCHHCLLREGAPCRRLRYRPHLYQMVMAGGARGREGA